MSTTPSIRINLLPYREQRRTQQKQAFIALLAGSAIAAALTVGGGYLYLDKQKTLQEARVAFLDGEIKKLDAQIKKIEEYKAKTDDLNRKKGVVEALQSNRSEVVHLFDELARQVPDGLFLSSVNQKAKQIAITGYAQSSARVSTFMRNLEAVPLLSNPVLVVVKAASLNGAAMQQFSLNITQASPTAAPEPGAQATKPAKPKG